MPIETDLNIAPYFDDYDENKNYHRVLFRPTTAVQARELTQLQSILQNQIERFGNWAFKNGDIVSGCAINDIPVLPYVRLDDFASNGASFDAANLQFTRVVSNTTGLQATVIMANNGFVDNYPNTNVIYVQYTNTGDNGEKEFSNTDQLHFYRVPLTGNAAVDNVAVINVFANSANTLAQSSYNYANTVYTYSNSAYAYANTLSSWIQSSYNQANTATTSAQAAFDKANTDFTNISTTAGTYGNSTYIPVVTLVSNGRVSSITTVAAANAVYFQGVEDTQNTSITNIQGVDNTQNTSITNAYNTANSAYNQANSAASSSGWTANSVIFANRSEEHTSELQSH